MASSYYMLLPNQNEKAKASVEKFSFWEEEETVERGDLFERIDKVIASKKDQDSQDKDYLKKAIAEQMEAQKLKPTKRNHKYL